ncbi:MAG: recombinase family protein [Pseudomonadota bacterium]
MIRQRCAIYTRKSTEEGLDQSFNSFDAQREACAAYILSQRHEGWLELSERCDDGEFSGGSMERPVLQQLIGDIRAGRIDVVLVYKVDRLMLALSDFAKLVESFDGAGVSFVSMTQAFNTTTSMGRLTLNVLLSFAQFEREVTAERIRDKVAASKKKGMWMGGAVPMGYDAKTRRSWSMTWRLSQSRRSSGSTWRLDRRRPAQAARGARHRQKASDGSAWPGDWLHALLDRGALSTSPEPGLRRQGEAWRRSA